MYRCEVPLSDARGGKYARLEGRMVRLAAIWARRMVLLVISVDEP